MSKYKRKDWESEYNALAKEARKLAKRANQRMVRLERYSERQGYKGILKYSYENAQKDIKALYGKSGSKLRFTENQKLIPMNDGTKDITGADLYKANVSALKNKIKAMNTFLNAVSSTLNPIKQGKEIIKPGIRQVYDKRTNTINERFLKEYGLELTQEDLRRFFESKKQAKLEKLVGSDQMFTVAAVIKKNNLASNKRELQKFFKNHIKIEGMKINEKDYKTAGEMFDALKDYVELTDDEVLNDFVQMSIDKGLNASNLFL